MILVAIGANLPSQMGVGPLATCRRAVEELGALPGLHLCCLSRWYETAPMPPSGQPPYTNAVAGLSGTADPASLLAALQAIETAHGRSRSAPGAPRTLDLDIVAMGKLVRTGPDPVVPHPRMHLRAFVLRPLADIAPNWIHPSSGQTIGTLLASVASQHVYALAGEPQFY